MITVNEFLKLDVSGVMFRAIDADKQGYMSCPQKLVEADRNVVREMYGNYEVVGFEIISKKTMAIYIKKIPC